MRKIISLTFFLCFSTAWASSQGGDISGGGDPNIIWQREQAEARQSAQARRARQIQYRINLINRLISTGELKNRLIHFVKSAPHLTEKSKTLLNLKEKGLLEDIERSPYSTQASCRADIAGQSREVSLATRNGSADSPAIGSPICVSVRHLAENISTEEIDFSEFYAKIIGIFLHDHARHFGLMDEDHRFAEAMTDLYKSTTQLIYIGHPDTTLNEYVVPAALDGSAGATHEAHLQLLRQRTSPSGTLRVEMNKTSQCTENQSIVLARGSYGAAEEIVFQPLINSARDSLIYLNQSGVNLIDDGSRYIYAGYRDPSTTTLLTALSPIQSQRPSTFQSHLPSGQCSAADVELKLNHQNSIHSFEVLSQPGYDQKLPEVHINFRCPQLIDIETRMECLKKERIPKKI